MYPRLAMGLLVLGFLVLAGGVGAAFAVFSNDQKGGAIAREPSLHDPAGLPRLADASSERVEKTDPDAGTDAPRGAGGEDLRAGSQTVSLAEEPTVAPEAAEARRSAEQPGSAWSSAPASEEVPPELKTRPRGVPPYEVLEESEGPGVREIVVSTGATREPGMRLIAEELKTSYFLKGVLLVEFYRGTEQTGFALAFGSRRAASAPDLHYTREEIEEIFAEDDGVRVVSYEQFGEEHPYLKDELQRLLF